MQEQGIAILSEAIKACTEEIESHKGKLTVKDAPRAVRITRYCQSFSDSLSLSLSNRHLMSMVLLLSGE